ncbi:MAG TPA: protein translocase subunit SecF, partial [SAR86 cluster bacterium]|nr:protein translocase subunit SecF [SAR86 cluster bacterium]
LSLQMFTRLSLAFKFSHYLGGEIIKNFALALIFGVIIGTYSSIYIAANALIIMGVSKDHFKVEEPENSDTNSLP